MKSNGPYTSPSALRPDGTKGSDPASTAPKVLAVDDERTVLRAYERTLTTAGFEVRGAEDGEAALEIVASWHPDVVVSDLSMPRMGGLAFLRHVRELDLDVPVLLVTGAPDMETAAEAVELGAFRYLVKPVDLDQLTSLVAKAAQLRKMASLKRLALSHLGQEHMGIGDRAGLEAACTRALDTLWMAYQPIVAPASRRIYAYEALLRTNDATLPHAGAVLDAVDRLGWSHALGQRVRAAVAATLAETSITTTVFVNLSPSELLDEALYEADAPLSRWAPQIVLELTERASLEEISEVRDRIARLRRLGFRVAIDDLGAGYAGLNSFAQLEPDVVKLDMALVRSIDVDPTKRKLVRAMIGLCRDMGTPLVCEGVETRAEHETLTELGAELFQGYLYARPGKPFPEPQW